MVSFEPERRSLVSLVNQLVMPSSCEEQLREISGREHVLLAGRATVALVAALRALDLPPGSEVLVPVMLCANPAHAVRMAGLRPLFVDIDPRTFNMDLSSAEKAIGPDTRVFLACPLFGYSLDCEAVLDIARRHDLIVIEDAAQAVGLRHPDRPAGSLGVCSVYSFGRGKIADAGGGAALLTDDATLARRVQEELRIISRAGEQPLDRARIGTALQGLDEELHGRACAASTYRQALQLPGVIHQNITEGTPLWKYSLVFHDRTERDRATQALLAAGIEATNLYRPLAPYFPHARNSSSRFKVAEDVYSRIVNLPLWPLPEGTAHRALKALTPDR